MDPFRWFSNRIARPNASLPRQDQPPVRHDGWTPTPAEERQHTARIRKEIQLARGSSKWADIANLSWALTCVDDATRSEAIGEIDRIVRAIAPRDLPKFEVWLRTATLQAGAWHDLSVPAVRGAPWPDYFWAMCTMHRNGYIREIAIEHLSRATDSAGVAPFLIIRSTDWVSEVRDAAVTALLPRLHELSPTSLLGLLELIDLLTARTRAKNSELWEEIRTRAVVSASPDALLLVLREGPPSLVRQVLGAASRHAPAATPTLIRAAIASSNPASRLRGAEAAIGLEPDPNRAALLHRMRSDSYMPIRRLALYEDLKENPPQARERLLGFLLDRHPSIRHAARHYLSGIDPAFDPATVYREAARTESGRRRANAVAGLGELGTPEDIPIIEPFVDGDRLTLAVFAVRAIGALGGEGRVAWATSRIADARPRVAKEAARFLRKHLGSVDVKALRDIAADLTNPHARWLATRLLVRRHPFDAVADAIVAATDPDELVRDVGLWWLDRIYPAMARTEPTPDQVDRVQRAIDRAGDSLSASRRAAIRSLIGV